MHASAIHFDLEDVLVNLSSISSNKDRGSVIEIAVVGSVDLRRGIKATPGYLVLPFCH